MAEGAGWLGSVEAAVKDVDWPGPLCCAETGCWSGDCDDLIAQQDRVTDAQRKVNVRRGSKDFFFIVAK